MIEFFKYEGAGNDFIMIDNYELRFQGNKKDLAKRLCNRHFGIGSDGMIFIEKSDGVDFLMDFYNPDGSQSFCGNGSRCAVTFAKDLKIFSGTGVTFKAVDGVHKANCIGNLVKVSMQDVNAIKSIDSDFYLNTGSPHYIKEVLDLETYEVIIEGRKIRQNSEFKPGGTNVNFIQTLNSNSIAIRTYERGVEDETLACGTGATAAAIAFAAKNEISKGEIDVKAVGGDLKVFFETVELGFQEIYLQGPAKFVFKGVIDD